MSKLLKALLLVLCAVALVSGSVAGTLAYLSMKTAPVTYTFTSGNINITLTQAVFTAGEQDNGTMLPGKVYTANPVVTVGAGSESCWLFIKIEESIGDVVRNVAVGEGEDPSTEPKFSDYLAYTVMTGWTAVGDTAPGVYYRQVSFSNGAQYFDIITGNKITAIATCTKAQYDKLGGKNLKLSFTAYAVQQVGFTTVAAAWAEAQNAQIPTDKY